MNRLDVVALVVMLGMTVGGTAAGGEFAFKKHVVNADSAFETCGVGDINRDGAADIMCGDTWYEAAADGPEPWKRHHVTDIKEESEYYHDFANELQDVNGDGRLDVVSCTWFSKEVLWREQPASLDQEWTTHQVEEIGNSETGFCVDIDDDGLVDFFPQVAQLTVWYQRLKPGGDRPFWKRIDVGPQAGHGGGVADVDGDGDRDIIVKSGWYEQIQGTGGQKWEWHGEFELGTASVPIVAHDFTGDGLPDIVWGMGHDYGMFWLEQHKDAQGNRSWEKHTIDTSWSQPHCVLLADLNEDGTPEVVTGKRHRAHNGHDPGGNDPLIVCLYEWNAGEKKFERHVLDRDTRTGFGLLADIADLDGDGDLDVICPGKSGLYWFENLLR